MFGLFRRGKDAHDEWDVAVGPVDVPGICNGPCNGRPRVARLVAFYNGQVDMQCNHCRTRSSIAPGDSIGPGALFYPDNSEYRVAPSFAPFRNDEDAEHTRRDYSDFNRKRGKNHGH